jgi:hypothetical protein|tara:strand:+ start:635 stop:1171 length:537 start_codon:yes stop_codon:yes gene_type:complete
MQDVYDLVKNIEGIYESNTAFQVLKDFERVLDELDIYVYANWEDGELAQGPEIDRHWITCTFMWPKGKMPDPKGGQRLLDYDCKVQYIRSHMVVPRKIRKPDDIRPGSKKGKLDRQPIWLVKVMMPKTLVMDIYSGYKEMIEYDTDPAVDASAQGENEMQAADAVADPPAPADAGAVV